MTKGSEFQLQWHCFQTKKHKAFKHTQLTNWRVQLAIKQDFFAKSLVYKERYMSKIFLSEDCESHLPKSCYCHAF